MKNKAIKISDYYNLSNVWYTDLFNKKLLWEVTPEIKSYITRFIKKKLKGFKTYKNNVLVGEGTIIKTNVVFEGKCIIGKNCIIGPNSYFREGVIIGDNSKVGFSCEIKNSIILNNTHISHLSYVGDSIIGSNVNIAAGVICTNFRFDEKEIVIKVKNKIYKTRQVKFGSIVGDNVKIGSNAVLNPGTILSIGCVVWPLTKVFGYHEKNKIIK